jgi:hypothetical protein
MNGEQRGFVKFINQTQMASFGGFIGELRWTLVALGLGGADVYCLTRDSAGYQATGLALAGILVGALVVKTATSAYTQKNVRESSREYMEGEAKIAEAKERGQVAGAAAAAVIAEKAADAKAARTNGAAVVHAEHVEQVTVTEPANAPSTATVVASTTKPNGGDGPGDDERVD